MTITVVTGSWARRYIPNERVELTLPEGATAQDTLEPLGIPAEEAGLFAIDDSAVAPHAPLASGDILRIFPAVMGG